MTGLSNPIGLFGIHQATIRDRSTYDQFALRVMSDFKNDNTQQAVPLQGGSSPYPWDVNNGYAKSDVSITVMQYDFNVLKYLAGYGGSNYTENASGEASGNVSALSNLMGTSVFNATTGIASATIQASTNPVFGDYLVKAVSATTVDVYLNNNLDGVVYVDDTLKITATPLTIPDAGATVDIPGTNLTLTGGSGTVALTTGDIAEFSVRPQNTYNYEFKGGVPGMVFPEFSLDVFYEKLGTDKYRTIHYPRVKANGVSFNGKAKDWASFDTTLTILYDSAAGYAWKSQVINR